MRTRSLMWSAGRKAKRTSSRTKRRPGKRRSPLLHLRPAKLRRRRTRPDPLLLPLPPAPQTTTPAPAGSSSSRQLLRRPGRPEKRVRETVSCRQPLSRRNSSSSGRRSRQRRTSPQGRPDPVRGQRSGSSGRIGQQVLHSIRFAWTACSLITAAISGRPCARCPCAAAFPHSSPPTSAQSHPFSHPAADGKARAPRPPRPPPRDGQPADWSQPGPQSQKDVEERKNRRNREDRERGPLQSSNFTAPDNA